jgi:plastocyanin
MTWARFVLVACAVIAASACSARPPEPVVLALRTDGSRTAFMPDTLSAPAGATVTLRLTNEGEIAHNLVVVRDAEAVQPIVLAAYVAIATQYLPTGFDGDMVASIPLVYPGQTLEVTFTMPAEGSYTYVCVFPGHGSTMRGVLVAR